MPSFYVIYSMDMHILLNDQHPWPSFVLSLGAITLLYMFKQCRDRMIETAIYANDTRL